MTLAQLLEFKEILRSKSEQRKPDKQTSKLLFYLFTDTIGDFTRLRIIMLLLERSYNIHKLAPELQLDYKDVQHHMKVLEKNNMILKTGEKYGAMFYIYAFLEVNISTLDMMIDKLDQKMNQKRSIFNQFLTALCAI